MAERIVNQQFLVYLYLDNLDTGEYIEMKKSITSISVKKDFSKNIMPLVVLNLNVTRSIREIIRLNNIKFHLRIEEFDYENDASEEMNKDPVPSGVLLDTTLKFFDKNINAIDLKQDVTEDTQTEQRYNITLTCIPENIYNKNSEIINTVYRKATNNEILIDILKNDSTKLYIEPSDVNEREQTIIIPPMNVSNAIKFLNNNYGVYNSPYSLFFDFDHTYLIKQFSKDNIYGNQLSINVISQNEVGDSTIYSTKYLNEETNEVRITYKDFPTTHSITDVISNEIGGNAVIGSYGSDYELITTSKEYNKEDTKVRYFWNPSRNYLHEEALDKIPRRYVSIMLNEISPKYFNILTKVLVSSDEPDKNGQYTIKDIRYSLGTSDNKVFTCTTLLGLSK